MRREPTNDDRGYVSYESQRETLSGRGGFQMSFSRTTSRGGELSPSSYNALIGVILLYGFGLNVLLVSTCSQIFADVNPIVLVVGYLILSIIGIIMSRKSDDPFISFIGYNLVVVPVGIVLSLALAGVSSTLVMNALATTTAVVALLLIVSTLYPNVFLSLGRALGITLLIIVIVEIALALLGITRPTFLDVIVAVLFCGYIGYDWAKAQQSYHSADNAVDACVGLYLDIVNLFLRILSLYSRRDD